MPIHQYSDIYLEDIYKYFDLCNVAVERMNKEQEEEKSINKIAVYYLLLFANQHQLFVYFQFVWCLNLIMVNQ